ncbi:PDZ and LIM domain protein 2-like [Cydia amplana]|uniref:PDZ and LIM domain protein 2-like n=1 Tax=Cydia amplana TaxID=1869771 RepID=UPI002FE68DE9
MTAREVELTGGAPWGFRMHGGVDQNQPLRISRVNPGRKASLCGVREGDVISSINGRATRGMSNADAHAMLRGAGPVLRLGLNEDREMSPRRRSISRGSELKRPSQLLASTEEATLQEPVYATIKPPITQTWAPSSPLRSSLNSLPSLNSTPLVKSAAPVEQPLKFHPTNPFYTTLPSNYTSASKLPISNGKSSISTLDRNKTNKPNDSSPDLKSPSANNQEQNSASSSAKYHFVQLNNDVAEAEPSEPVTAKPPTPAPAQSSAKRE